MNNFFYFFFKCFFSKVFGYFVKNILRLRNIKIGKNFSAFKFPLIILDKTGKISIGDNVEFFGEIELRATNNASININNNVKLDKSVRLLATNNANLRIDDGTKVGAYSILNAGDDLTIGRNCLLSSNIQIQCSSHNLKKNNLIQEQGYLHSKITIGDDVLIGTKTTILMGAKIEDSSVVGANSLVLGKVEKNSIVAGIPAKTINTRD